MRYSRLRACLVICATMAISNTCWGVDIPFEFLYGRWVKGHVPYMENEVTRGAAPQRSMGYHYTAKSWQIGLSRMRGNVVFYDDKDSLSLPVSSFFVRPASNWQIGLDSMTLGESVMNTPPSASGPKSIEVFRRDLSVKFPRFSGHGERIVL